LEVSPPHPARLRSIRQWTTEIERSFGQNFVTGIAYVGSAGSHLDMPVQNWNNPDPGLGDVQARKPCGNRLFNVVWSES